jgi:hypothetical protein
MAHSGEQICLTVGSEASLDALQKRCTVFYFPNLLFQYPELGEYGKMDVFETFTSREAASLGVVPVGTPRVLYGVEFRPGDKKMEPGTIIEESS